MNKQEFIEKLEKDLTMMSEIKGFKYEYDRGYEQAIKEHLAMISDLDWPDKPVVPQFVADWIETHKRCMPFLSHLFTDNLDEELKEWLAFSDNQNLMAKAWLFGYEIEKEKKYMVILKGNEFHDYLVNTETNGLRFYNKLYTQKREHTRKELEEAGFGWVFDCDGIEIKEVE
jgi:hypothetical protein|nr:MAG TPA: Protein of unknown function (DUF1642) [Caudoviricetes sp.]